MLAGFRVLVLIYVLQLLWAARSHWRASRTASIQGA
jgi:hypothetical protein